uniref:Uncharacterized protein n=1 Tax=Prevotella sp. GTC17253 TaxID=3236793 RepID=A0AB33ITM3_9BACT
MYKVNNGKTENRFRSCLIDSIIVCLESKPEDKVAGKEADHEKSDYCNRKTNSQISRLRTEYNQSEENSQC